MTQRKGQFIFNALRPKLQHETVVDKDGVEHFFPYANLHAVLFGLSDEDFEKIEQDYRKYVISKLHNPKDWENEIDEVTKTLEKRRTNELS
jgi:hypothetical protein